MANNFESNITRKLMEKVLPAFDTERVVSKEVNTQLFQGSFNPSTGDTIDVQRPTDYTALRTAQGDVTGQTQDIITGKASATVQDYITVLVDYSEAEQALEMGNNADRFATDIARRIKTELETSFASFCMKNSGLTYGTPGNFVDSWSEVAGAGALMSSTGVPDDGNWCYLFNPYSQTALANEQRSLGVNPQVADANSRAVVSENFAGFKVMRATSLDTYTIPVGADRVGTLAANPIVTYVNAKDTMTQVLSISGLQANLAIPAGQPISITGVNRLNLSTRKPFVDQTGSQVEYTAVVVADAVADGAGAVTLTVTGPAIFEAGGAYNTVTRAPISGDVVTLLGAEDTINQPNLFFHRDAFTICSVPMEKLDAQDTLGMTEDGLQLRVSKGSDFEANRNKLRIDLRPAFGAMNPFMAGHGYGVA